MGIGFGVIIQVLMILYHTARPYMEFEVRKVAGPGDHDKMYLSVTPHAGVVFPAVTHVRAVISDKSVNQDFPKYVYRVTNRLKHRGVFFWDTL